MKKTTITIASICWVLFSACVGNELTTIFPPTTPPTSDDNPLKQMKLNEATRQVMNGANNMAFNLLEEIQSESPEDENFMLSPLSLSELLGMLANGAQDDTRSEIQTAMGFEGLDQNDINNSFHALNSQLPTLDKTTTLSIANSIWLAQDLQVEPTFTSVNKQYFDAEVRQQCLYTTQTMADINSWCATKTHNCIPTLLQAPLSHDCRMALINALYFKGMWQSKFDKRMTRNEIFHGTRADAAVDMMHQCKEFRAAELTDCKVAEFPYGNGAFCLDVVLPNEGVALSNVAQGLNEKKWTSMLSAMRTCDVDVAMPRMELRYERELNHALNAMGVKKAFSPDASFRGISNSEDLYVSLIKQLTYIRVDEEGTEAAAVTAAIIKNTSVQEPRLVSFHMDRPFLYIIRDTQTGTILFMGRVMQL